VPEYFADNYTTPSCNSVVKELTQTTAWHRDWFLFISESWC